MNAETCSGKAATAPSRPSYTWMNELASLADAYSRQIGLVSGAGSAPASHTTSVAGY